MKKLKSINLLRQKRGVDLSIASIAVCLSLFGLLMIYEASSVSALREFGNKYHFVSDQVIWFLIGVFSMVAASLVSYKRYHNLALPLFLLTIFFLVTVLIPGIGIKALGARRWIKVGLIGFQPSELAKLSLIIYLSAWFRSKEKGRLLPFLMLLVLLISLVVIQPDMGTAIILFLIAILLYFICQAPIWHFLLLLPLSFASFMALSVLSPYRFARLVTFLNPEFDPLGASYHIRQIFLSLGSGGLMGVGLGSSRQKFEFLPEATTDSIFAIIGEEFGFVGSFFLILVFLFLLFRIYKVTTGAPDRFGFFLASGVLVLLTTQLAINLGSQVALLPLTGTPLPFISYGGSSLVMSLTAVGIVLNISRHRVTKS